MVSRETAEAYSLGAVGAIGGALKYYIKPELNARRAWTALAAGVIAYELACPQGELMSEGVDRGIDKHPVAVPLLIGVTALHLANILPESIDPFSQGLKFLKSRI